jgi:GNAT superfamily N-acetyltransferase
VVEIQQLTADDWRLWRELRLFALAEAPEAFGTGLAEWQGNGDTEARWRNRMTAVPFNVLVVDGGRAVGQVSGLPTDDPSVVELISMYVHPEARGTGAGAALVESVCEWARGNGANTVILGVKSTNVHARRLYERCGFSVDQSRGRDDCDVSMARTLGSP